MVVSSLGSKSESPCLHVASDLFVFSNGVKSFLPSDFPDFDNGGFCFYSESFDVSSCNVCFGNPLDDADYSRGGSMGMRGDAVDGEVCVDEVSMDTMVYCDSVCTVNVEEEGGVGEDAVPFCRQPVPVMLQKSKKRVHGGQLGRDSDDEDAAESYHGWWTFLSVPFFKTHRR
ncbi:uncharacterized protein TEOVI_000690800 [Trypanosoma equiperdum]|nr:hypothetical protein, conserved [Trypanosoma equiperdum]